ncbi:shikimate dehydrogenase [Halodesulfovibrio marinisediminis]|uniref:Shikimate dehydrogenase (NADP(+)) n=1 Tax=Halodesulfovibrio marinisediminis DSM 17456 TaxID=1121457 RepID=A0A1N6F348_9BACT|nr:shikimate dehydrogenase [Halodesulfovibrio marinisediminis]SIN89712.1 shikimate dehydrogenase [Halodesulfovibrio marinisediminis DSM 17456]
MTAQKKLYGIIGHPLGHTMSPALHNSGFNKYSLNSVYMAFPTPPEKLPEFMENFRSLPMYGASVTIPHKEAVIEYVDKITPRATTVGAVNTLYWEDDTLVGDNTDVIGFMAPLKGKKLASTKALVLGAGGAAKAVLAGLQELCINDVTICNRTLERAEKLAAQFSVKSVAWDERGSVEANLVINTTPMGMSGEQVNETPFTADMFTESGIAYDLVYNPLETVFLRTAKETGWETIDGLHMFAAQGAEQFRLWTGKELPIEHIRKLISNLLHL